MGPSICPLLSLQRSEVRGGKPPFACLTRPQIDRLCGRIRTSGAPRCRGPTLHLKFCKPSLTVPLPLSKIEAEPRAPPPIPSPTRAPTIDSRRKLHQEPAARVPLKTTEAFHPRRPPVASLPDPSGAVSDVALPMLACCPDSSTGPQPLPHSSLPPPHSEKSTGIPGALHSSFLDPFASSVLEDVVASSWGGPEYPT